MRKALNNMIDALRKFARAIIDLCKINIDAYLFYSIIERIGETMARNAKRKKAMEARSAMKKTNLKFNKANKGRSCQCSMIHVCTFECKPHREVHVFGDDCTGGCSLHPEAICEPVQ